MRRRLLDTGKGRMLAVLIFMALSLLGLIGLLIPAGVFSGEGRLYTVKVVLADADNAVANGQVRIAGIEVGNILSVEPRPGGAIVTVGLHDKYAPLHQGVSVRVGSRSLVEETYLDLTDGTGPEIPDGATLPGGSVRDSTQLRDVLDTLDARTRASMGSMLRSSGAATAETHEQVGQLFAGIGHVGREGGDTLTAVAAQSEDLKLLARDTTTMLKALDTGQGQIATMVENANRLTEATAEQRPAIEAAMVRLPGVLDSAHTASASLRDLSGALRPVANGLGRAAPELRAAVHDLPAVSSDLRRMMPDLGTGLDRAPDTLHRVGGFSDALRKQLIPNARDILRDANPMLRYLRPYGPEVAGLFSNFSSTIGYTDETGRANFHAMVAATPSMVGSPVNPGNLGKLHYYNPIPAPGQLRNPGPFSGKYPRIERQPR